MGPKKIVLQIFTGGFKDDAADWGRVEGKLKSALDRLPVEKVIAGWALAPELYLRIKRVLEAHGAELYLWLPAFSEISALAPSRVIIDDRGKPAESFHLSESENFEFYCPNAPESTRNVIAAYEAHFRQIPFDGVFLDKIRYGSFANGLSGVFGCFCPECTRRYGAWGLDADALRWEMENVRAGRGMYRDIPLGLLAYEKGDYAFSRDIWRSFFACKASAVTHAFQALADYFRESGLKVGADVFAPCLAYFVGQDVNALAASADFVKPMLYGRTNAPAGLPFEYRRLIEAAAPFAPEAAEKKLRRLLPLIKAGRGCADMVFVRKELEWMASSSPSVYAGIEINRLPDIAPIEPRDIVETLSALADTNCGGFVLSWDLLSAPSENIDAAAQFIHHRR